MPSALDPAAFAPSTNPLSGVTDIDLRRVGAFRIGDPRSKDPAAPGVLVLESRQGDVPRILPQLGAEANRPDSPLFDGGYTVLEVREIAASGFAGDWRSAADNLSASGHFCAWRFGDEPKAERGEPTNGATALDSANIPASPERGNRGSNSSHQ